MKYFDRLLQRWRIQKAAAFICPGSQLLDIGCGDGALFCLVPGLRDYVGIEPGLERSSLPANPKVSFYGGYFPDALPVPMTFDVITMLAVLEHVPPAQQAPMARACASHLKPGGKLVITVPSPVVDDLLAVLQWLRIIDGMSLEQHYGFESAQTPQIFSSCGLRLIARRRFQLGLNNLFVFERPRDDEGASPPCRGR